MNRRILIGLGILLLVVLAAGGGFYAGTVTAQGARQGFNRGQFAAGQGGQFQRSDRTPQPGQQQGGARPGPGGGVMGTIKSAEGNTLIVTTSDGDTQVNVTDTTLIEKYTTVGVGDLSVGERVVVSGSQNDDGSITARSIQSMRNFQAPQSQ